MKQAIYLFFILLLSIGASAQAPQQISYQAVVRNNSNALVANSTVGVSISIVRDSANGAIVYSELQTATTNANGLFSIIIGNGLFASGSIASINWGNGVYYIKSQIDPNGGINFTISGTSQLLSVPYALYAANGNPAGRNKGDLQYWDGSKWVVLPAGANGTVLTMSNGIPTWATATTSTASSPSVTTISATANGSTAATAYGIVTANGGATITARGFCWSSSNNSPTLSDNNKSGTFTSVAADTFYTALSGLAASTNYYIRAYATNSAGTSYGSPISITTPSAITTPTVTLLSAVAPVFSPGFFTPGYGASLIGSNGGSAVTAQGICWSTSPNPTLSNFYIGGSFVATNDTFNTTLYGMNPSSPTTYYLRAYATNSIGTSYSNQIVLQVPGYVSGITAPTVTTVTAANTSTSAASLSGVVNSLGGATVTARGFCWSTNANPTLSDNNIIGSYGTPATDTFYANLSNLAINTTYYVRAYATNSAGTAYGNQVSFTTSSGTTTHKIGESYGGGTVFYVDATGHGLIASSNDIGNFQWDLNKKSDGSFIVTGATDTTLGSGSTNTSTIKSVLAGTSYAGYMAAQTASGYSDWYLPSLGELQLMFLNLATAGLGNLSRSKVYWSSSEYSPDGSHQAWVKDFGNNSLYGYWKSNNAYVRAIRKF